MHIHDHKGCEKVPDTGRPNLDSESTAASHADHKHEHNHAPAPLPRDKVGNFVLFKKSKTGDLNFWSSVNLRGNVEEWIHYDMEANTKGWMFETAESMLEEFT